MQYTTKKLIINILKKIEAIHKGRPGKGGRGGQPNMDRREGGRSNMDRFGQGGGGVQKYQIFRDVLYG